MPVPGRVGGAMYSWSEFLVGKIEDMASLAKVCSAFNACAKKLVLMARLALSTRGRFRRMEHEGEASSGLLEYLRLISSHYPGVNGQFIFE